MFFKKEETKNNNFLTKVCALLIHAAKIDENYTDKEEEIIKRTLNELGIENENVSKIIELIERKHSYKCPCIVFFDIEKGNKKFLSWIKKNS